MTTRIQLAQIIRDEVKTFNVAPDNTPLNLMLDRVTETRAALWTTLAAAIEDGRIADTALGQIEVHLRIIPGDLQRNTRMAESLLRTNGLLPADEYID
jgi:hypothetical protein